MTWRVFLLFQALYALTSSGNAFRVPDEFEVYYQVEHLVDAGDLSVPQAVSSGRFFGRVGLDGKPYAPYGPLGAFLSVPHHLLARGVAAAAGIPRGNAAWTFVVSGLTMLSTSTAAALAVAGFHRAALALGASSSAALLLSMLLGGASVMWTYGANFYSEAWQAAAFIWAAVFLLERRIAPAAALMTIVGLIKVTSLVFTPGFLVAVLMHRDAASEEQDPAYVSRASLRAALALVAGITTAVVIHIIWNQFRFGDPFEFGYDWAETVPLMPARAFMLSDLPRGLAVLLFAPGKSIFVWAPCVLLSIARLRACPRPLVAGVSTAGLAGLIIYGMYLFPEGGYAHGPRHLVPIVPLLLLPAAAPGPPWPRRVVGAIAAVGVTIAALSVSVSFLQDQALGNQFTRLGYYERIDPAPGRAWNRYKLDYVPFVKTITSGEWPVTRRVGAGADLFPLHLMRARAAIGDAQVIPAWLPWSLVLAWSSLLVFSVMNLRHRRTPSRPLADLSVVAPGEMSS